MGGVINTTKKAFGDTTGQLKTLVTHPSKLNLGQVLNLGSAGGLSPITQAFDNISGAGKSGGTADPSFNFDPNQSANDSAAINAEGEKQYNDTMGAIDTNSIAQTKRAKDLFGQMLPDIAENAQAAHLYDSTGYGQEVGRQQANIASQVASDQAQQRGAALAAKQGFQTGALQRGMGLEDFINQANVSKAIGAQMAPQAPSSKATGTSGALSGAGSGATIGTSIMPGWGTAIGAVGGGLAGYMGGASANKRGGGK